MFDPVQPDPRDIPVADTALHHIRDYLDRHSTESAVHLVVDDDGAEELVVPRGAIELLARILAHMAAGKGVSVVPTNVELTTQQAADLLHVSRPFLINLLSAGEIEYHMVGTHRRVHAESLLAYLRRDDKQRQAAADELTALTQEMGLY